MFLGSAVDHGLLCHPKKLIPPCQEVKYCGFLFNTETIPCLKIPVSKRERALSICEHLLYSPRDKLWSRLSLAVAASVLESLSEATPRRMGHNKLRAFHSLVHPSDGGTDMAPYYTTTLLNDVVLAEIKWWHIYLLHGNGRQVRSSKTATLVPMFGDGSGTGTGGTFVLPDKASLMWSAIWSPVIYSFSSNWKELATLREALHRLLSHSNRSSIVGTTVFYFTDNTVTYFIALSGSSKFPRLRALISEIRLLEIQLGILVEVVHVPGVVMIQQGTDGLSRGIWMSTYHSLMDERRLLQAIFDPITFDPPLVWQFAPCDANSTWKYMNWSIPWDVRKCFDRLMVWCPPPEFARQVLTFLLNTWVERPATTSALIFVPRTCSASRSRLSRFIQRVHTIYPSKTFLRFPPILPIPIEVLYLAPHSRVLSFPPSRLDSTSLPASSWHQDQAALMRGLPPTSLQR